MRAAGYGDFGLSPRVRGNHGVRLSSCFCVRSIPACAGEPTSLLQRSTGWRVYPRVCGGTGVGLKQRRPSRGLSPRVRGNHAGMVRKKDDAGSIPACAGEPVSWMTPLNDRRVYPRVCGGTGILDDPVERSSGLSPRVRGNLEDECDYCGSTGSIPACAGEPTPLSTTSPYNGVYPRVCGGTRHIDGIHLHHENLSPRVRGNPVSVLCTSPTTGSIPACAGEPRILRAAALRLRVYPRVCGGTRPFSSAIVCGDGLSPRVRGNLSAALQMVVCRGSIPACAGEPRERDGRQPLWGVYPRVCGGTRLVPQAGMV